MLVGILNKTRVMLGVNVQNVARKAYVVIICVKSNLSLAVNHNRCWVFRK